MDGDWVFSATTTCAILPEPNLDTVGKVVLRNRSAVRVSGPLIAEFRGISALVPKNVMDGDWVFWDHDLRYSSRTKFGYSGKCGSKKPVRCSRLRSFNRRIPRNKRPCAQKCDGRRLGFLGNHDLRYSSRTKFGYSGKCGSKKPVRCSRLRSFNRRIPRNKRPCAQKCDGRRLGFLGNHDLRYSSRTKFGYSGKCGSKKPVRCSRLRSFNRRIPRNKRHCAQKCDGRRLGFLGNHDLRYSSRTKFGYSGKCGSKKPVRCSRLRSFNRRIPRNKRPSLCPKM